MTTNSGRTQIRALSAKAIGALAVAGVVIAFSFSSTLGKEADSPGVLLAFWRLVTVIVLWNAYLWATGRRVTMREACVKRSYPVRSSGSTLRSSSRA